MHNAVKRRRLQYPQKRDTKKPTGLRWWAKSGLAAANNAFESAQKAAKQVAEVAESNFQTLTAQAAKAPRAKRA